MKYFNKVFLIVILLKFTACDDKNFSPFESITQRYAVSCVLDNRLSTQLVFAQQVYSDKISGKLPSAARIILSENFGNFNRLKDTLLSGMNNCSVYYLDNYKLKRDTYYRIGLFFDSLVTQWSETIIPAYPWGYYFSRSDTIISKESITITYKTFIFITKQASDIHEMHLFVEYYITENGSKIKKQIEIPVKIKILKTDPEDEGKPIYEYQSQNLNLIYPGLRENKNAEYYTLYPSGYSSSYAGFMTINGDYIMYALSKIDYNGNPKDIVINRAYAVYYSIDRFLYQSILKTGKEQYSVRLDEPINLTNMKSINQDGLGRFGAITADTIQFKIVNDLIKTFEYVDGQ